VAVHGTALNPDHAAIIARVRRMIPVGLWTGTMDASCPVNKVRKSRDILESAGFPVELNVLPNHGHDYFTLDGRINEMVWKFLKKSQLPPLPDE
jgi:predicted esterase